MVLNGSWRRLSMRQKELQHRHYFFVNYAFVIKASNFREWFT